MSDTVAYFAYGSNMDSVRFRERIPSAAFVAIGWVDEYRLVCHKVSKDGSGKADIVASPDSRCWGVIYRIRPADLARLDKIEGGYDRKDVVVQRDTGGPVAAATYMARDTDDHLLPLATYTDHIIRGASDHGLPEDYVSDLRSIPTVESRADPNH